MLFTANLLSAIGAMLLLIGYYQITVRNKEPAGMMYSGIGSFVMCIAFYLFESNAFIALNIAWMGISIYGLMSRNKNKGGAKPVPGELAKGLGHGTLVMITMSCLFFYSTGNMEVISWLSIGLMLMSFFFFSLMSISRKAYVVYSLIASLLALPYVLHIVNYSSAAQLSIDIVISAYSLIKMRSLALVDNLVLSK